MKKHLLFSLLLTVAVTAALGNKSNAQEAIEFVHGCGAGCRVKARLISEIEPCTLTDGREASTAVFLVDQTGGGRGKTNTSRTLQVTALCNSKEIAFTPELSAPTDSSWIKLTGDEFDYTTVALGRGYYFDALCRK